MLARGRHDRLLRPHSGPGHQRRWPSCPTPTARTTTPRSSGGPLIHRLIAEGTLPDGYATENGTGLVFFGTELVDAFTEVEGKLAYSLTRDGAMTREVALETRLL